MMIAHTYRSFRFSTTMDIPLAPILLSLFPGIYLIRRWRRDDARKAVDKLGLQACSVRYIGWSIGLLLPLTVLLWGVIQSVPPAVVQNPNVSIAFANTTSLSPVAILGTVSYQVVLVTFPEELFFRGYLGGLLMRRYGFLIGNTVQALIFGVFHVPLVLVDQSLGAIVAVQLLIGWGLGWLRYHSESIVPGWVMHALANSLLPVLIGL